MIKNALLYIRIWYFLHQKTSRKLDLIDLFFLIIAFFSLGILSFMITEISISDKEAYSFFYHSSLFFNAMRYFASHFGQNDLMIKMPLLILHFLNLCLFYGICRYILHKKTDALFCLVIYACLPGVNLGTLFLIESNWITFFTFFIGYFYTRYKKIPIIVLSITTFLSSGAMVLLLGIAIFMLKNQKIKTFLFCLVCIGINFYFYDFDIGGKPQTYFLETLGQIAMLYSPLLFIYYAYSIYWGLRQSKHLLPYISATSIVFCIILSLRQNINFYIFIPQSLLALPIMMQCFLSEVRIRLPQFRKTYYLFAALVFSLLFLQTCVILGNKITYLFSNKPNFASSYYFGKEIATQLKELGISAIHTPSSALRLQLLFYGINDSKHLKLLPTKQAKHADIIITYNHNPILLFKITQQ